MKPENEIPSASEIELRAIIQCTAKAIEWADCSDGSMRITHQCKEGIAIVCIWDQGQIVIAKQPIDYDLQNDKEVQFVNLITTEMRFVKDVLNGLMNGDEP